LGAPPVSPLSDSASIARGLSELSARLLATIGSRVFDSYSTTTRFTVTSLRAKWKRRSSTCSPRELNLSLAVYLDDCTFSHELKRLLLKAGHDVETPADVHPPLTGEDDDMNYRQIIQAISNLENTGVTVAGGFWSLNA
jgi:hypothetical protein